MKRLGRRGTCAGVALAILASGISLSEARPRRSVRESREAQALSRETFEAEEASAASRPAPGAEALLDLVDIPTAEVVRYGNYDLNFRLYSEGGVLARVVFGVFRSLNLGGSWDVRRLIGTEGATPVRPRAFVKWRVFDGGLTLPAVAIGFDDQGFLYDDSVRQYRHREKGVFLVGTHEVLFPDLEVHGGVNMYDFERAKVFGFVGGSWRLGKVFVLVAEYDNLRSLKEQRVNVGLRFQVAPPVHVEATGRDIGHPSLRERIIRISYRGSF
ncbi:MAG: hypothetical protein HYZ73_02055 [Elusimicrobia bacterium]|nr:hypothetical protein [Elusimicrobiota bacterium]